MEVLQEVIELRKFESLMWRASGDYLCSGWEEMDEPPWIFAPKSKYQNSSARSHRGV